MIFSYGRFRNCYRVRTASWPWATGRTAASEGGGGATLSRVVQGPGTGPRLHPYAGHRPSSRFNKTRLDYNTGGIAVVLYRHQQERDGDLLVCYVAHANGAMNPVGWLVSIDLPRDDFDLLLRRCVAELKSRNIAVEHDGHAIEWISMLPSGIAVKTLHVKPLRFESALHSF